MAKTTTGIVDLGGARFKAAAFVMSDPPEIIWQDSVETGGLVSASDADAVRAAVRTIVASTRAHADRVVAYGGGLLRRDTWRDALLPTLAEVTDEHLVLDERQEGELLLLSATRSGGDATHLIDIGGESVQLVTAASTTSWPVGTFAMERRWGLRHGSPAEAYEKAGDELRELFDLVPPADSRLAVGSGMMGAFMASVAPHIGVTDPGSWRLDDLERAWRFCAALPTTRFPDVFPVKPGFMYGAEKAMLVAWVVATALSAGSAYGTAASVMDGMAWRLVGQPIDTTA